MIDLYWVVQANNYLCFMACAVCFLHALHGGIYTNNLSKWALYLLGFGFYSGTVTIEQVVMPGYKYILIVNVFIALMSITFFIMEAHRAGCLASWIAKVKHFIFLGDIHARHKHR